MHAPRTLTPGILAATALAALLAAGGCRGERSDNPPRQFLPDMDDQQKWKAQAQSPFFTDGRTMRPRLEGTVAFGRSIDPADPARADLLKDDAAFYLGLDEVGQPVEYIPPSALEAHRAPGQDTPAALAAMIARGQERYNIYCSACHSYTGDGKGAVGARWSYPLPTYHDEKYTDRSQPTGKDGHLFSVIRNGVIDATGAVKMPPYGHAVAEADAWAIVAYLRTLQASWSTDLQAVPADKRSELQRSRPAPTPAAQPSTPPSNPPPAQPAQEGRP